MDLYRFEFLGRIYSYTSGIDTVVYNSITYKPSAIKRTEISLELTDSEVRVTIPLEVEPFTKFVVTSPSTELSLKIINYAAEVEVFTGIMTKIVFDRVAGTSQATFKRKEAFFDSEVPYRTYGTSCSFGLYSVECGVNDADHSLVLIDYIISEDRRQVSSSTLTTVDTGTMTGGYVKTNEGETFYVLKHVDNILYLDQPIIGDPVSLLVKKGCNKLFTTCKNKFNNSLNFGGFPLTPTKNPVTDSI